MKIVYHIQDGIQVSFSICTKIQKKRNIWETEKRYRKNIERTMQL